MAIHTLIDVLFFMGTLVFSFGFLVAISRRRSGAGLIFVTGMICQGVSLALRYKTNFPLLPVFQGPFFLPFAAGLVASMTRFRQQDESRLEIAINTGKNSVQGQINLPSFSLLRLSLVTFLSWSACLFPNDFYLPFLQFKTPFAHLFFFLGVAGKALFLYAGVLAGMILAERSYNKQRDKQRANLFVRSMNKTLLWGFFFWTLSIFSGAAWSWLGWGSPVIWDDPVMATTMATWLFYSLVLHLHLTRFSSIRSRALACAGGALFVFCFTCVPEFGPFRVPGWQLRGLI